MTALPIGTKEKNDFLTVKKGDVLRLVTGEAVTFLEMRRTRFLADHNGKNTSVPLYRDKAATTPFVTEIIGFNADILPSTIMDDDLTPGQLFALDGHKETFMFKEIRGTKLIAYNVADKKLFKIGKGQFTIVKIDLDELTKDLI